MLRVQDEDSALIVFFLYDDEDQSVRVEEVEEISFFRIDRHLSLGGSVFITHRREPQSNTDSINEGSKKRETIQLLSRCL